MRRYDDPVEVRSGSESAGTSGPEPSQFLWRGRLYVVREVLAHWIEVGAWWRDRDADGLPRPIRTTGREVWRVTAQAGRSAHSGTYDLTCSDLTCSDLTCSDSTCSDSTCSDSTCSDSTCSDSTRDDRDWRLARALD